MIYSNNISTVVCSSSIKISRLRLKKTNYQNISALTIETEFLCTMKNKKPPVVTISNQLQAIVHLPSLCQKKAFSAPLSPFLLPKLSSFLSAKSYS